MKSKIEFTKVDESSFDGTNADRYSVDEAALFSQHDAKPIVSGALLSFEQCLREEFLVNTQNYPKEYHQLFKQKYERAEKRFREQSGNDR